MSKETLINYLNQLITFIRWQYGNRQHKRYGICFYLPRVRPLSPLFSELVEHRLALHTDARDNGLCGVANYIWDRDDEGDKQRIQWLQDWIVELNAVPKFTEEQNMVYLENTSPVPCNTPANEEEVSCPEPMTLPVPGFRNMLWVNEAGEVPPVSGITFDAVAAAIDQIKKMHEYNQLPMTSEILENLIFEFEGQSRSRVFREGICYYTPGEYMTALKERLVEKGYEPCQYCWGLNRAGNELRLEFLKEWWEELKSK